VVNANISDFLQKFRPILANLNIKLVEINDDVTALLNQEKSFSSSEFLRVVMILKKIGVFSQTLLEEVEEQKQNSTEFDFIWTPKQQIIQ
jgi:hypothetical protein